MTAASNVLTRSVYFDFSNSPTFTGTVTSTAFIGDLKGSVFADDSSVMVDAVDNKLYASGVTATGNITGNYFLGNGSQLTGITTNSIFNGTSNIRIDTGNGNITANVGATANVFLISSSGANITGTFSVSGNTTSGNLDTGIITATGNISSGNLITGIVNANVVSVTGNATTGNLSTGIISASGNISAVYINTTNEISALGNVTAPYFIGNVLGNISGNLSVAGGNTQVIFNDNGVANATAGFTFDKATNAIATTGTFSATGNITGTFSVSGNTTSGNLDTGIITATLFTNVGSGNTAIINSGANGGGNIGNATGYFDTAFLTNVSVTGAVTSGSVSATGNVTGGNLITAGILSVNSGNAATAIINAAGNGLGNIGSSTGYFDTVFAKATSAQYADVAEAYLADFPYQPGTVLSIGGRGEVTMSQLDADPMVIGVVSTSPAIRMNDGLSGRNVVQIALLGRVPAYVRGPVRRGEMLVSAGNGRLRSELNPKPGSIVGKALENFDGESGLIEVLVGRN